MASASGPQDLDRAGVVALGRHCELRLGIYFWFRLFNVVPETTARFSRFKYRSRSQSPPCQCASRRLYRYLARPPRAQSVAEPPEPASIGGANYRYGPRVAPGAGRISGEAVDEVSTAAAGVGSPAGGEFGIE